MAREITVKGRMGALQRLLARLNGNREKLPHLEMSRGRVSGTLSDKIELKGEA